MWVLLFAYICIITNKSYKAMIKLSVHFDISFNSKGLSISNASAAKSRSLASLFSATINSLESVRGKSTIDNYRTAVRSFLTYAGEDTITSRLTRQLFEGYQRWQQGRGVTMNSASCYMRSLRALLAHAGGAARWQECFATVYVGKGPALPTLIPVFQ